MGSADRPIRILHIVSSMNRGGIETWLLNVLRHIDRERFRMDFLVHTDVPAAYDEEIRALGSQVIPCLHPSRPMQYARNLSKILKEHGPYDIVHSHVYLFSGVTLSLSKRAGVSARIAHVYPEADKRQQTLFRHIYTKSMRWLLAKSATLLVADSGAALSAFQTGLLSSLPAEVIYPVVDLKPFRKMINRENVRRKLGLPLDLPLVLYVARFVPHKNHQMLIDLAERINSSRNVAHFLLCGADGPTRADLESVAQDIESVSVFFDVPDVAEVMAASDVFLFPSSNEGFGIVAIEAQAAGLPVVASNLATIREALAPELHSLTFSPDDIDAATENLWRLLADSELYAALSSAGQSWIKKFSIESSVNVLTKIYRSVLTAQGSWLYGI
jgi:glycosyltransferase involved in cell wall biosynthesis